jgi:chromosome partitioning protein
MTIYCVANTKGGVGKTTTAINIAAELVMDGRDPAMVNGDRQPTADIAIQNRNTLGTFPPIPCFHLPDGPQLRAQVLMMQKRYQDIVIDVGGRDSSALRAAMVLCDVMIIPFQPRSMDVWAFDDLIPLIDEVRSLRGDFPALALLNMADPGEHATDNRDAAAYVANFPQLRFMSTVLRRRKAFANAAAQGLSVAESRPRDAKAIGEVVDLMTELRATVPA